MTYQLIRGDAAHLDQIDDGTVDAVISSPPYFGLRSYTDDGEHYEGQGGSEETPGAFIDWLVRVTAECRRVLKPSGSMFINLGDCYHDKGLRGLPWRYAIRCIDDLDLILRAEIVWAKPNGLPESVTDRVRRSHETWFHFTKEPRYYSAVDEIREPYDAPSATRSNPGTNGNRNDGGGNPLNAAESMNPLGKLPGSVWEIPTAPLKVPAWLGVDHFAAFPVEWPRRLILGWTPSGVCTGCGQGRRPQVAKEAHGEPRGQTTTDKYQRTRSSISGGPPSRTDVAATITGYVCDCPDTTAPTTPAVILDPFTGTGTTVAAAHHLGRHGIGIDLSNDYLRLAEWRINDPKLRAKILGTAPPEPVHPGQGTLL